MKMSKTIEWEEGWEFMKTGFNKLVAILEGQDEHNFTSKQYMELFTKIYNMCSQKPPYEYTAELYVGYREVISDYINLTVFPDLIRKQDVFLLIELLKRWSNHKIMVKWLLRFFHYLDLYYVARNSLPNLAEVGQTCFRDLVCNKIKDKVKDAIFAQINQEREGVQIDRALLRNVMSIFIEIGVYEDFEVSMIENTANYYSRKASKHLLEDSCPEYMLMVEECLESEKDRVSHYLHSSSEPKLIEKIQHVLLFLNANQLLEKEHTGLQVLLQDSKVEDLSRMYRLFSKIDQGLEPASFILKKHVTSCGLALVKEAEYAASRKKAEHKDKCGLQEQVFVNKVIELHDKYTAYCRDCFRGHIIFYKAIKEAFEVFCNKDIAGNSSAEIFATCCDNILKYGGIEKLSDEAIDEKLDKIVTLLGFLHQKDLLAEFARNKLARRLLSDINANGEHEMYLLTKLKRQFSVQFTSKMEAMIKDINLVRETQVEFEKYLTDKPHEKRGIDMSITVLTSGYWPTYQTLDLNIPAELINCIEDFKNFYQSKTKPRRLTWLLSQGSCNVIGQFHPKPIELQVSTFQAATLLLFNTTESLSFQEIVTQLNLPTEEVMRLLHSLSCGKYKILIKEPNTKVISQTDTFEFNLKFTDKMERIKVPLPHIEEKKKVVDDVDRDRRYTIDAAIVRIMKSRKFLSHKELVLESLKILHGIVKPDIKMIRHRIGELIERDYMERDLDNLQMYRYLA